MSLYRLGNMPISMLGNLVLVSSRGTDSRTIDGRTIDGRTKDVVLFKYATA